MSQELLLTDFSKYGGGGTFTTSNEGLILTGTVYIITPYIELPTAMSYEFDFILSIDANDQIYLQIERFDANKNTISNNAAWNCTGLGGLKPTSAITYQRYKGAANIATFNTDTVTKYIRLRVLNGYNSTTGTMKVHSWSLRAINNDIYTQQTFKNGQLKIDHFRESYGNATFSKNGFVDGGHLYEY